MNKKEALEHWSAILSQNKSAIDAGEKARRERESLIIGAVEDGVSKTAIHRVTGISRTSIYNILDKYNS